MGRPPPHPHPPAVLQCRRGSGEQRGHASGSPAPLRPAPARPLGGAAALRRTAPHRTARRGGPGGGGRRVFVRITGGGGRERCVRQPFWGGGQAAALPCASRVGSRPFLAAGEGAGYHTVYSCGTRSSAWGEGPVRCGACKARRGRPAAILWSL